MGSSTSKTETKPEVYVYWDLESVATLEDDDLDYVQTFLERRGYAEESVKVNKSVYYDDKNKPTISKTKKLEEAGYDLQVTSSTKAAAVDRLLTKDIKTMQQQQNRANRVQETAVVLISADHDFYDTIRSLHMTGFTCCILRPPLIPGESFSPDLKLFIHYWERVSNTASMNNAGAPTANITQLPKTKETNQKAGETQRRCAGPCGKTKSKTAFSRNQWETRGDAAKCRICMTLQQNKPLNLGSNPPSLQKNTRRRCTKCAQVKSRNEYSRNQWMTKGYTATCKDCITASTSVLSTS